MNSMQTTGVYPWEFELSGEIQEFHIWYSQCIDAIMFVYKDNNNKIINSPRFGSKAGGTVYVEKFDAEDYILGVRGSLGFVDGIPVVSGFQWLTTRGWGKSESTPSAVGTYDLSLASGDKRLRFYGNYGTKYLHSFGFAAAPHTNSANGFGEQSFTKKDRAIGGPGEANKWEFNFASQIRGIDIMCGSCVDSITFHYRTNDNNDCSSTRFGGNGGLLEKVRLDDNEKIIGFSGTVAIIEDNNVITSISFATSLRTHGPFGTVEGMPFSLHRPQAIITEFYGYYGQYLDSIGAVFHDADINNGYVRELGEAQMENNPAYVIAKDRPFGGDGAPWEFSFPDKLREIHIWSDKYINSIMFVYSDNDNKDVKSQRFGGEGGNLNKVTLRDDDFLTGFGGSYGDFEGNIVIMSIRFQTTQLHKRFGSINQGNKFDVVRTRTLKLTKFHGNYGTYLHSIGAVYDSNGINREHVVLPGENINGSETIKDKTIDNDKSNVGVGGEPVRPVEKIDRSATKRDGPFGGNGGVSRWEFKFAGEIREIHISSGKCVNSIAFVYRDRENRERHTQDFGGNGALQTKSHFVT